MKKHRLAESEGRVVRQSDGSFRICIVDEGQGSSADWPRDFFEGELGRKNADVLVGAISFPNHPKDYDRPEDRDPMTAIGRIGKQVDIEEHDGKLGFWADFIPSRRPGVIEHLEEFGDKLAVSVFCEGETRTNPVTGREEAVSLFADDPYRSVDVVNVGGRGGRFAKRMAESHRRLAEEASAPAGEKNEEIHMDEKAIKALIDGVTASVATAVTSAIAPLTDALKVSKDAEAAAAQAKVDDETVDKAVDERLADYDKAVELINEAQLTESQSSELRARARKGEDIADDIASAKKVLAEARKGASYSADQHIGGGNYSVDAGASFDVAGFGKVGG